MAGAPWPRGFPRVPDDDWVRQAARGARAHLRHGSGSRLVPEPRPDGGRARRARSGPGDILLDYSGGTGILAERLLTELPEPEFGILIVDASPKFLRVALEKLGEDERVAFRLIRYLKDERRLQTVQEVARAGAPRAGRRGRELDERDSPLLRPRRHAAVVARAAPARRPRVRPVRQHRRRRAAGRGAGSSTRRSRRCIVPRSRSCGRTSATTPTAPRLADARTHGGIRRAAAPVLPAGAPARALRRGARTRGVRGRGGRARVGRSLRGRVGGLPRHLPRGRARLARRLGADRRRWPRPRRPWPIGCGSCGRASRACSAARRSGPSGPTSRRSLSATVGAWRPPTTRSSSSRPGTRRRICRPCSTSCGASCPRPTSSSSTTARPTGPPQSRAQAARRCSRSARTAGCKAGSRPGTRGRSNTATPSAAASTPTASTRRPSCGACSSACAPALPTSPSARGSSAARATSRTATSPRASASSARASCAAGCASCSGSRSTTRRAGSTRRRRRRCRCSRSRTRPARRRCRRCSGCTRKGCGSRRFRSTCAPGPAASRSSRGKKAFLLVVTVIGTLIGAKTALGQAWLSGGSSPFSATRAGGADGLHPICAARLEAAERVADGADAVLLSGWARRRADRPRRL